MRISDWSSDVCSSDLLEPAEAIADDDPAPGRPADVSATPVERGAEAQQGIAGGQAGHDRLVLVPAGNVGVEVAAGPQPGSALLPREGIGPPPAVNEVFARSLGPFLPFLFALRPFRSPP